ncbi:MAG: glycosyltransferase family 4 protein [Gemmatimonadota bacterium]
MTVKGQSRTSIGYLVQQFPPEVGAGPARVGEMAVRWCDRGAEVTVVTAMPNRPQGRIYPEYRGRAFVDERWEGIRVLRSWLYARPNAGFARTLLNNVSFMLSSAWHGVVRLDGVDVLIASSPPFFPHLTGACIARIKHIPLILEIRDLWPDYLVDMGVVSGAAARALFALERWVLSQASRVVVVTEAFARRVVEKGVPSGKIEVLPNAVDTQQYFCDATGPPIPELERADGEYLVGYLGHFGRGQALETVVAAAEILADSDPDVRFVLVGDGPERKKIWDRIRATSGARVSLHPSIPKESMNRPGISGDSIM